MHLCVRGKSNGWDRVRLRVCVARTSYMRLTRYSESLASTLTVAVVCGLLLPVILPRARWHYHIHEKGFTLRDVLYLRRRRKNGRAAVGRICQCALMFWPILRLRLKCRMPQLRIAFLVFDYSGHPTPSRPHATCSTLCYVHPYLNVHAASSEYRISVVRLQLP